MRTADGARAPQLPARPSRRRWLRHALGGLLLGGAWRGAARADGAAELFAPLPAGTAQRQVRFNLTISNPGGQMLRDQVVRFYLPVNQTATQQLDQVEVSMPYELEQDALGNRIAAFRFASVAPFETRIVRIRADLRILASPRPSRLAQRALFLREEQYIESADPAIQALARRLAAAAGPADGAAAIHAWVRDHLHYAGYIAEDLGARAALLGLRGDCTEYADLAVALARASGIPARTVDGYVMAQNGAPRANEFHTWSELYVDGGWRLLDAQKGNFDANADAYIATRIVSEHVANTMNGAHRYRVDGALTVLVN